jgi:hypothetical protein
MPPMFSLSLFLLASFMRFDTKVLGEVSVNAWGWVGVRH